MPSAHTTLDSNFMPLHLIPGRFYCWSYYYELRFTARHESAPQGNCLASDARRLGLYCQGTYPLPPSRTRRCISSHQNAPNTGSEWLQKWLLTILCRPVQHASKSWNVPRSGVCSFRHYFGLRSLIARGLHLAPAQALGLLRHSRIALKRTEPPSKSGKGIPRSITNMLCGLSRESSENRLKERPQPFDHFCQILRPPGWARSAEGAPATQSACPNRCRPPVRGTPESDQIASPASAE